MFGCQAVIVERVDAVRDVDVVARKSGCGFDPSRTEAQVRITLKKREGQHLAGAIGEEMPVGPVPAPDRIVLHVDLREEHALSPTTSRPPYEPLSNLYSEASQAPPAPWRSTRATVVRATCT